MGKLMKYELRKTMGPMLLLGALVLITEGLFLFGLFSHSNPMTILGGMLLAVTLLVGILGLGICGILSFHKDLNTKQSYMMFLLPKSSYELMGAKMLENFLSIAVLGIASAGIVLADYRLLCEHVTDMKEIVSMLGQMLGQTLQMNVTASDLIFIVISVMESWIMMVSLGFLAVTVTATVLNGKKFGILVAGALYFLFSGFVTKGVNAIAHRATGNMQIIYGIVISLVVAAVIFVICGKIMDKKLDV